MPAEQKQQSLSGGQIAALVARACMGKDTSDCTLEFALDALQKKHPKILPADLEKAKDITKRVLDDVVGKKNNAEELEAFAAKVENLDEPFAAEADEAGGKKGFSKVSMASKAELQAAVKTLGMGPSAYKGLPKDDPEAYCQELQNRVLAYVKNVSGDSYQSLPSADELAEMKKAVEAKKELSSLDASNIIPGRPKRRAASSAAEAIKRDIAQDLEREAAQAASEPQKKKQKAEDKQEDATDDAAAPASSSSSSSSSKAAKEEAEKAESEEEEDESDDDEGSCSEGSQDSSGSESSDDDEEEEEEEAE